MLSTPERVRGRQKELGAAREGGRKGGREGERERERASQRHRDIWARRKRRERVRERE